MARKQGAKAVNQVGQLAHIARPRIGLQRVGKVWRKSDGLFASGGVLLGKKAQQQRHVGGALAQRRRVQGQHVEAVVQVFAKAASGNLGLQVAMGGSNHTHVHGHGLGAAHRVHHALLQHAQQLDLQLQRQVANLVQKDGAVLCQLKAAYPVGHGAGKRALAVAKELALDQVLGDGRAVDRHKVGARAVRQIVQRTRHNFLARAALARDQHGRTRRRHHGQQIADRPDGIAFADKPQWNSGRGQVLDGAKKKGWRMGNRRLGAKWPTCMPRGRTSQRGHYGHKKCRFSDSTHMFSIFCEKHHKCVI